MLSKPPTVDEWLKALSDAAVLPAGDSGATVEELSRASGWSDRVVRRNLRELVNAGKWTVGFRHATRLDGQRCKVPVYAPKKT